MNIILLNGPPRSGKDHAGLILWQNIPNSHSMKMAKELKERCHAAQRLLTKDGTPLPHNWFESVKDTPCPEFEGKTPREAYISFSENWIKPTFGKDQLGIWLSHQIDQIQAAMWKESQTFIVTDCGFQEEAEVLVRTFGPEVCKLIRIYAPKKDFSKDSRSYIHLPDVATFSAHNNGTDDFEAQILACIS